MKPESFAFHDVEQLRAALACCWSAETSDNPSRWSVDRSTLGQCAVTALVVQDIFGGDLLRCICEVPGAVHRVSHYANKLTDGRKIDLTLEQFPPGTMFSQGKIRTRQYVLSYPETMVRYGLLLTALGRHIAHHRLARRFVR